MTFLTMRGRTFLFVSALLLGITELRAASVQQVSRSKRSGILTNIEYEWEEPVLRSNPNVCGIRRNSVPDIFTRIVGGTAAEKNEFPWQVSLQWRYNWLTYHICGATVLSESWVITAAHCTQQYRPHEIVVVGGLHNVKRKDANHQDRTIDRIAEHWAYNPATQENDIALLHLSKPFQLNGMSIAPVCLPPPNHNFRENCVVSGWGKESETGQSPEELRKVVVPIISKEQCIRSYKHIGYSNPIPDTMLCAGYSQGRKDACQGDSGGPFVCRGRDNRYMLAGIVSWGIGCARPNVPGVYTQVSRYIPWISSIVNGRTESAQRAVSIPTSLHLDDIASEIAIDVTDELSTKSTQFNDNNGKDFSNIGGTDFGIDDQNHFGLHDDDKGEEDHENGKPTDDYVPIDHFNLSDTVGFSDDVAHEDDGNNNKETSYNDENNGDDVISGLYFGPGSDPIEPHKFGMDEGEGEANIEYFKQPKVTVQH